MSGSGARKACSSRSFHKGQLQDHRVDRHFKGEGEGRQGAIGADGWWLSPRLLLAARGSPLSHWTVVALTGWGPRGAAQDSRRGLAGPSSPPLEPGRSQRRRLCLGAQRYMLFLSLPQTSTVP